ncbi:MAG: HDOD domain-containing protein [Deltaproteobacteria bacterium]|nr:HDOD domain-containing protein [Deltaproteobacteria bacterium]
MLRRGDKYGQGTVELSDADIDAVSGPDFKTELTRLFASPNYQPPAVPVVAMKVMELSRKAKVEFEEVVSLLEQDPMLAGKVMTRIQSPVYASSTPVRTLRAAVIRLGLGGLRDLVMEVTMHMRVFRAPGFSDAMDRLRRHSLLIAHIARIICRYVSIEADYAFLCGLLHDVGIAAILVALGEGRIKTKVDPRTLWRAVEDTRDEASALVARLWKLPPELQLVIGSTRHIKIGGYVHPILAVLLLAHVEAERLDGDLRPLDPTGTTHVDKFDHSLVAQAREALRFGPQQQSCVEHDLDRLTALQDGF